jgi:2-haloacid dehalogenase
MSALTPKALIFDVFGTCVDWRGSIIAEGRALDARWGTVVDWAALADAWRGRYQPALDEVRSGRRPWTILDVLHRESLDALAPAFGLDKLDEAQRDHLNRVWHRLTPWADTVAGLTRLKRRFILGPLSNGNFALLTNMAKHAGFTARTSPSARPISAPPGCWVCSPPRSCSWPRTIPICRPHAAADC